MKKEQYPCDLCGQPVKVSGFELDIPGGPKKFCCAGCVSIYQLLNPEQNSTHSSTENIS
ncbi:heavy metal translocating P-type ATPase metal-binding domain-containing protein [Methylomonas sp. LL1]|uniref:heavy metal translocating P-type ATPase metal-binding domain-containing protein n=1 Tax=Methylomonas sp. LL1 TaxID=2785785 RepID=UPI0018C3CEB9|nr:heavy metal translocating P-type ATPase metal-binding domain-containing protein [Methylomonas sp. LL1]QPK61938.1 heavy metal translocating P-type ATPase metal-binding domain-containing protein [Methylomonas sp. LL1]